MKKIAAALLLLAVTVTGCYTTKIVAPPGATATVAPKQAACFPTAHKRVHYLLFGLVPLGDNSSESVIQPGQVVQVTTEADPVDVILRLLGGFTFGIYGGSQSIKVSACQ